MDITTTILDPMFGRAVEAFDPELDAEEKVVKTAKDVALESLKLVIHSWIKSNAGSAIEKAKGVSNIDADIGALEKERRTLVASSITLKEAVIVAK